MSASLWILVAPTSRYGHLVLRVQHARQHPRHAEVAGEQAEGEVGLVAPGHGHRDVGALEAGLLQHGQVGGAAGEDHDAVLREDALGDLAVHVDDRGVVPLRDQPRDEVRSHVTAARHQHVHPLAPLLDAIGQRAVQLFHQLVRHVLRDHARARRVLEGRLLDLQQARRTAPRCSESSAGVRATRSRSWRSERAMAPWYAARMRWKVPSGTTPELLQAVELALRGAGGEQAALVLVDEPLGVAPAADAQPAGQRGEGEPLHGEGDERAAEHDGGDEVAVRQVARAG